MAGRAPRTAADDRAVHRDASTGRFVPLPPPAPTHTYSDPDFAEYVRKAAKRIRQSKMKLRAS